MKNFWLSFVIFLSFLPDGFSKNAFVIEDPCSTIRKNYELLKQNHTKSNEMLFFNAFPNNFSSFVTLFGYQGRSGKYSRLRLGCEFNHSSDFIKCFFDLKFISKIKFYNKILFVSKNAQWQSDGVSYFQQKCVNVVLNESAFLNFLNSKKLSDVKCFNNFILNDPIENENLKIKLIKKYSKYHNLKKSLYKFNK